MFKKYEIAVYVVFISIMGYNSSKTLGSKMFQGKQMVRARFLSEKPVVSREWQRNGKGVELITKSLQAQM